MPASKHVTDLRQLCCLGLGEKRIMPVLFDIVQKLVPADLKVFIRANDKYEVADLYSPELPKMADVASLYITHFVNTPIERRVKPSFSQIMKTERGVINWVRYENKKYFASDFYNLLLKPAQVRHLLGVIIRDQKRALGELTITRAPARKKFTTNEERTLESLIPYIAHGLTECHTTDIPYIKNSRKGLIVLDQNGKVQYLCEQARELLFWAMDPRFSQKGPRWSPSVSIPDELLAICRNLVRVPKDADAPPPVWNCRNGWGLFSFRAYWLEKEHHVGKALLGVMVEMHEPQLVHMLSWLRKFPLSPRQKEVCMLLLSGCQSQEISRKLNVSRHTLIHHIRSIYEKMGLRSQADLFAQFRLSMADRGLMGAATDTKGLSELSH